MALVVITCEDVNGEAVVSVQMHPPVPTLADATVTPAQQAAATMLRALEQDISQDRGLIQLIN